MITRSPAWCSTRVSNGPGHRIQRQFFILLRCRHREPRRSSGLEISTPFLLRVSRSCNLSDLVTQGWSQWRTNSFCRNRRSISRWSLTCSGTSAAAEDMGYGSITTLAEERVEGVRGQLRVTQSALTNAFVGKACVVTPLTQEGDIQTQSCPLYGTTDTPWGP